MADVRIEIVGPITPEKLRRIMEEVEGLGLRVNLSRMAFTYTGDRTDLKTFSLAPRVATQIMRLDEFQLAAIGGDVGRSYSIREQVIEICGPNAFGLPEMTIHGFFKRARAVALREGSWLVPTEIVREMARCEIPFADVAPHEYFISPTRYYPDVPKPGLLIAHGMTHLEFFELVPSADILAIKNFSPAHFKQLRAALACESFNLTDEI